MDRDNLVIVRLNDDEISRVEVAVSRQRLHSDSVSIYTYLNRDRKSLHNTRSQATDLLATTNKQEQDL